MDKLGSFGKFILVAVLALGYQFVAVEQEQETVAQTEVTTPAPQPNKREKIVLTSEQANIGGFLSDYATVVSSSAKITAIPGRYGRYIYYAVTVRIKNKGKAKQRPNSLFNPLNSHDYQAFMDILDENGESVVELGAFKASKSAIDAILYGEIDETDVQFVSKRANQSPDEEFLKKEYLHTLDLQQFRVYSY